VPVGLGAVDVRDVDEHALSATTAQTPSVDQARLRGRPGRRRSVPLRPFPGIAHLTVFRSRFRHEFDAATPRRSSTNRDLLEPGSAQIG
jgi:hypothetical protein